MCMEAESFRRASSSSTSDRAPDMAAMRGTPEDNGSTASPPGVPLLSPSNTLASASLRAPLPLTRSGRRSKQHRCHWTRPGPASRGSPGRHCRSGRYGTTGSTGIAASTTSLGGPSPASLTARTRTRTVEPAGRSVIVASLSVTVATRRNAASTPTI